MKDLKNVFTHKQKMFTTVAIHFVQLLVNWKALKFDPLKGDKIEGLKLEFQMIKTNFLTNILSRPLSKHSADSIMGEKYPNLK